MQKVANNGKIFKNYIGVVFFCVTDQFLSISIGQVLQMPGIVSVFKRERLSHMYSSSAYYLAAIFTNSLIYMFQPIIYASFSFYFLEIKVDSPDMFYPTYMAWIKILILQALMGSTYGFMYSCIFENPIVALIMVHMGTLVPYFSAGFFTNLKTSNRQRFIEILGKLSPFKYACEAMIRTMLQGYGEQYVEQVTS
jgi:hypothetical protein